MILLAEMMFAIIVLGIICSTAETINKQIQTRKLSQFMMNKFTPDQIKEINERMGNKHD
ncbi:hypothetical protein ACQW5G_01245 [Fructilactobacillus sp. Tb1]|uniref:hypothetical protein n=1 Tax=Fructilactobacillus sp. Tb1 TaxID=3422304 RepID=UPI003D2C6A21